MDNYPSPDPYGPPSGSSASSGQGGWQPTAPQHAAPQQTAPQQTASQHAAAPPYGAQPYGAQPGPQPYGWPGGAYNYGPPPQPQGTNGFAIAGLVLGIIPVLAGILGIVFGAIGLKQTKRTGQNGRGLALAGIILGSLWLVLIVVLIVVALATDGSSASRTGAPTVFPSAQFPSGNPSPLYPSASSSPSTDSGSSGDSESAFQVAVGECLRNTPDGEVRSVDQVPCSQPHAVEAYASFDLSGSSYPGDSQISSQSQSGCKTRFPGFVGTSYDSSSLDVYFLHPTRQSWTFRNDRQVLCLVGKDGTSTTGTLRNTRR